VDVTRTLTSLLDTIFVGEIVLAAALLSRRTGVDLGAGTRAYHDQVLAAAAEGDPGELAVELISRVTPRLIDATSTAIEFGRPAAPSPHPAIPRPAPATATPVSS
jgi:hypothetical protein